MDTQKLADTVRNALESERESGDLLRIVKSAFEHQQAALPDAEIESRIAATVKELTGYVASLPEMVEAAVGAAERAGVVDQIRPLLTAALQYVDEEVDFIPDHLGVVGLLDDAYVVRGLLIEMSHRHRALTGESLVDHNRAAQDQRIRRLIGEPTATRLDIAIVAFARSHNIRETVETVVRKVGGAGMAMQLPVAVAFGGGESIDELPNLELGALGA